MAAERLFAWSAVLVAWLLASWSVGADSVRQPARNEGSALFGVVQSDPRRVASDLEAGVLLRTLEFAWDAYEPAQGRWNEAYMEAKRAEHRDALAAGAMVVVDLGLQYPPSWLLERPHARFVDQHDYAFESSQAGASQANGVFNRAVRDLQARYVHQVLAGLVAEPFAVRLGWGWYGEIGFPPVAPGANSYWAYDAIAQGLEPGLPTGVRPSPVPGWRPPAPGAPVLEDDVRAASRFVDWYLESLTQYQRWQISTVREVFSGRLFLLYPSFGVRPGQIEQAVRGGLAGATSVELNGELQRGFDFQRFVNDLDDPQASPYTTWLDAEGWFIDDQGQDPSRWSPVRFLSELATAHPLGLEVWGENTGDNQLRKLDISIARVHEFGLRGMFWAFNADLYEAGGVTIHDFARMIADASRR